MTEARDPGPEAVDEILASLEDFKWPPTTVARQARRLRAHITHLRGLLKQAYDNETWDDELIRQVKKVAGGCARRPGAS